ncbi:SDR family NAD(P)-dependent oxidoreductase [Mycobacterium talmoniae]|uniref:7-alpha-hydroxysteroid dehydrogenase n=1 Tax=Mycobacterium talmoniae TaxID=1858794 RepID=A0A1S1NR63_9MYCO|nr:SDR family oxidoreductase [Mycobacterium talmoniae]OHV06947.1 7-alpha-hydroxysteroid dehydrogenase [Mycobacterium talmoniae]PQM48036.1 NADP-dependent 7-alpha-hydroxysteroid dehydrogenase [Mycobacterium talmoniae]
MAERLDGRVAVVTGAGSGIGAASAAKLAEAGAAVAVTDIDLASAQTVAAGIADNGYRAIAVRLDVADEAAWLTALDHIRRDLGRITVLHSNAALTSPEAYAADLGVVDLDIGVFDRVLAVNLRGGVLGCKHVIPDMLAAGGGSIVLTSSVKGLTGSAHRTAYSVSKGGLDALTRMVAAGYGKAGVRCNAVAPGIVMTEAAASIPAAQRAALEDAHLTPSLGRPVDIARAVVFLASDAAAFITGQVICVDGGLVAHTAALSPAGSRGKF